MNNAWNQDGADSNPIFLGFLLTSPTPEYFSILSGSCVPSPAPSPAPSVAGSVASSSSSLRFRRPLISPARLNLKGQQLRLFVGQSKFHHGEDLAPSENSPFAPDRSAFPKTHFGEPSSPGTPCFGNISNSRQSPRAVPGFRHCGSLAFWMRRGYIPRIPRWAQLWTILAGPQGRCFSNPSELKN